MVSFLGEPLRIIAEEVGLLHDQRDRPSGSNKGQTDRVGEELLSDRELEVLGLLAVGESYKEIG